MAFWSVVVKHGQKPGVFVPPPEGWVLHLSQAALPATVSEGARVSLVRKDSEDGESVVLCTLKAGTQDSVPLDLFLDSYSEFSLAGGRPGVEVHVTGYYSPPEDVGHPDEDEDEEFDPLAGGMDEDDDMPLIDGAGHHVHFLNGPDDTDEDEDIEEDDSDDDMDGESDEDDDEAEEDSEEEPTGVTRRPHVTIEEIKEDARAATKADTKKQSSKEDKPAAGQKGQKQQQQQHKGEQKDSKAGAKQEAPQDKKDKPQTPALKQQDNKQPQKRPADSPAAKEEPSGKKSKKNIRTFENGFSIEEVALGPPNGKLAKKGKRVFVQYTGRLKSNGKVFDASKGRPFAFRLGVGEVIKGWDLGVEGMRVGDKRKLVIPPQMAYGPGGVKGSIPPNATLEFDVELVDVK